MSDENIEVVPSEESGNVPAEAPSEPSQPETPAVVETVQPTEPELYELPDGRKVDAETLTKEWKENFAPEFTRRSQELAQLKTGTLPTNNEPSQKPYANPDYVPQSYEELIEIAKAEALNAIEQKEQERIQRQVELENAVATQLSEVKTLDPNLNENALFLHATKYGFRDLKLAYQNMKDMSSIVKSVQETTVKNIAKRTDPVSISPGASGIKLDPSAFSSSVEYLRSLKQ